MARRRLRSLAFGQSLWSWGSRLCRLDIRRWRRSKALNYPATPWQKCCVQAFRRCFHGRLLSSNGQSRGNMRCFALHFSSKIKMFNCSTIFVEAGSTSRMGRRPWCCKRSRCTSRHRGRRSRAESTIGPPTVQPRAAESKGERRRVLMIRFGYDDALAAIRSTTCKLLYTCHKYNIHIFVYIYICSSVAPPAGMVMGFCLWIWGGCGRV